MMEYRDSRLNVCPDTYRVYFGSPGLHATPYLEISGYDINLCLVIGGAYRTHSLTSDVEWLKF